MSPLISKQEWNSLFSKELYLQVVNQKASKADDQRVRAHSLKYLAVINKNDSVLLQSIENPKQAHQLNTAFTKYKLTLVHILVMRGRSEVLKHLLKKKGVNVNPRDAFGCTPLHHAVLVSDRMAQLLLHSGADENLKNALGGTFNDLKNLTGALTAGPYHKLFFQEVDGNTREVSGTELATRTGFKEYIENCQVTDDAIRALWCKAGKEQLTIHSIVSAHLLSNSSRAKTPPLCVREVKWIDDAQHFGVFALQAIPPNCILGEIIGEVIPDPSITFLEQLADLRRRSTPQDDYMISLEDATIDQRDKGNVFRFVNDGFNSRIFTLYNHRGLSARKYVVSARPISSGDEILFPYGPVMSKWGKYSLQNQKEIYAYLEQHPLSGVIEEIKELEKRYGQDQSLISDDFLAWYNLQDWLLFMMSTPAFILAGVLRGKLTAKDCMKAITFIVNKGISESPYFNLSHFLAEELANFEMELKKMESNGLNEEAENIRKILLERLPETRITDICSCILLINQSIKVDENGEPNMAHNVIIELLQVILQSKGMDQWVSRNAFIDNAINTYKHTLAQAEK